MIAGKRFQFHSGDTKTMARTPHEAENKHLQILILEDRAADAELMVHEIERAGYHVEWRRVETEKGYRQELEVPPDIILADFSLPDFDALRALILLRDRRLSIPFIVVTGTLEQNAIECMKQGASDYLLKDRLARLGSAVQQALDKHRAEQERHRALEAQQASEEKFRAFFNHINDAAFVYPLGEDGVPGKFFEVNDIACRRLGYTRQQLLCLSPVDIVSSEAYAALANLLGRLPDEGPQLFESAHLSKTGRTIPVEVHSSILTLKGQPTVLSIARDITKRRRAERALRASEQRFRVLANSANDAVVLSNHRGEILFINQAGEDIFGYDASETCGAPLTMLMPERFRSQHERGMGCFLTTREPMLIGETPELVGLRGDGEEFPLELSLASFEIDQETYFSAIIRDITDRKRDQERIQAQLGRLQALRTIDQAIVTTLHLHTVLHLFLVKVLQQSRFDAGDILLLDEPADTLRFEAGLGFHTEALRHTALKAGEGFAGKAINRGSTVVVPDLRKDAGGFSKSPLWPREGFRGYIAIPLVAKRGPIGVLELFHRSQAVMSKDEIEFLETLATQAAIAIDNASMYTRLEQHAEKLELAVSKATEELKRAKERVETILDNSPDTILLLSPDGIIEMANPACRQLLGREPEDLRGKPICSLVEETHHQACRALIREVMRDEGPRRGEYVLTSEQKGAIAVEFALSAVREEDRPFGLVCSIRDISALKEVERMKDAFVSNVSHELRNPITSLKLNHGLLERNPDKQGVYLERLGREIDRLNAMIEDLLRLSRLDQGKVTMRLAPVDLNEVGRQFSQDRAPLARDKELDLTFEGTPELSLATADQGLLGQALSVLITNAINYTPAGGKIHIRTQMRSIDEKDWCGLSVEDTGPGVDEEDLPLLFERFYRGKAGRQSGAPGTGLGLSIAKEILDRLNGWIELTNRAERGALFTLWLPALPEERESGKD
jgi:two-component system phosphate regulon sensor histidine kinase PhoR